MQPLVSGKADGTPDNLVINKNDKLGSSEYEPPPIFA
jgi:hypothetical protein